MELVEEPWAILHPIDLRPKHRGFSGHGDCDSFSIPQGKPKSCGEGSPLDSTQGAGTPSILISNGGERAARNRVEVSTRIVLIEKQTQSRAEWGNEE